MQNDMNDSTEHRRQTSAADVASCLPDLARLRERTAGSPAIPIAVLDGDVDLLHPCFAGADLTVLQTLVEKGGRKGPALRHGTHIVSVIFGQPGSPVHGIAPRCRGILIPVFGDGEGETLSSCSQLDIARAIVQALQHGARVINISGGTLGDAEPHPLLSHAVRLCHEAGVLIVAAAGNEGCRCLHVPAALPSVLAVGAMDAEGRPLAFSNWGDAYREQGILVPGEDIAGAVPGGGVALRCGTSQATAVASGVCALLLAWQLEQGRRPDVQALRNALLRTAVGCERPAAECARLLAGRLDLAAALNLLNQGEPMSPLDHLSVPDFQGIQAGENASRLTLSECGCKQTPAQQPSGPAPVYALGMLDYDFESEARRDSFVQQGLTRPDDPAALLEHLESHPWSATAVTWVLTQETTPLYAIQPGGPYADKAYDLLRRFLREQLSGGVEQVSLPGHIVGKARLSQGQTVPLIWPELRGMYSWSTSALVDAVLKDAPAGPDREQAEADIANFLERVYYEVRNLGVAPQERAINHAATNAFQLQRVYASAIAAGLKLDAIGVERSPVCRPESDCWDVKLTFFHPTRRQESARVAYRFTIDVSDVVPVTVGKVRHWHFY